MEDMVTGDLGPLVVLKVGPKEGPGFATILNNVMEELLVPVVQLILPIVQDFISMKYPRRHVQEQTPTLMTPRI